MDPRNYGPQVFQKTELALLLAFGVHEGIEQWFSTMGSFAPRGYLATSEDIFFCPNLGVKDMPLASIGQRPEILRNILQYTGQAPTEKNYLS